MSDPERARRSDRWDALGVWGLAILVMLSVTGRSLWIDEFSTAMLAMQASPWSALRYAYLHLGSEAFMPAWVALVNLAAHVFGTSELGLRIINAFWLGLAVYLVGRVGPRKFNLGPALGLAVLPFTWYYGNQARPYALQMTLGAAIAYGMWVVIVRRASPEAPIAPRALGRWLLVLGVIASAYVSLTSAIVSVGMAATFAVATRVRLGNWPIPRSSLAFAVGGTLPALTWYAWLLVHGSSGSRLWQVGVSNIAFGLYEILGFSGWGPGRLALRAAGVEGPGSVIETLRPYAPWLILHGALLLGTLVLYLGLRTRCKAQSNNPYVSFGVTSALGGSITLVAAAFVGGFPLWGRHFAPAVPVLTSALGLAAQRMYGQRVLHTLAISALVISLAASSAQMRLSQRHSVEDYKSAVSIAESTARSGIPVDWLADGRALTYYNAELRVQSEIYVRRIPVPKGPILVILSKPDIYDPEGTVKALVNGGDGVVCPSSIRGFTTVLVRSSNGTPTCASLRRQAARGTG